MWTNLENNFINLLNTQELSRRVGHLTSIHGMVLEAAGLDVHLGELVKIIPARDKTPMIAEVVGLHNDHMLLMPYASVDGLCLSSEVVATGTSYSIPVGKHLLGRILDAIGQPLDDKPLLNEQFVSKHTQPINPLHRTPINQPLITGIKAIDLFTPLGKGQRIGIFAGSGVGKSTLLGMISKNAKADVIIVALIGERGREVGDFIRDSLGSDGLKNVVMVVASADQPAVLRRQAAYTATSIAEWFRDQGQQVLLIMDSITRFCLAQREIGLATGEPMGSRGYPPSVFGLLAPLLERAGTLAGKGSITSIYTVLVEGDDMNEPISDHMRAILDGHITLSRHLAALNHYPAIDILHSISRLSGVLRSKSQKNIIDKISFGQGSYNNSQDLIQLGAYQKGSNPLLDIMIELQDNLKSLLCQSPEECMDSDRLWGDAQYIYSKISAVTS